MARRTSSFFLYLAHIHRIEALLQVYLAKYIEGLIFLVQLIYRMGVPNQVSWAKAMVCQPPCPLCPLIEQG